jgi:hypothetical protein
MERRAARFTKAHTSVDKSDQALLHSALTNPSLPASQTTGFPLASATEDQDITALVDKHRSLLTPIGIIPCNKGDGVTRILYENVNGLPAKISNNEKLAKLMENIDDLEVDLFAFNEHKINFKHKVNRRQGLGKLLDGGETLTRAVGGNISHPFSSSLGKCMEGGTGIVAYGELASLLRTDLSGMDSTGLARWSYMTFSGREGHMTSVIVGYNPCKTGTTCTHSTYQLHRAYLTIAKKDQTCPRRRFEQDLLQLLTKWRQEGRRLVVCLDANDHVYRSRLGRALISTPDLDLSETMLSHTGNELSATYFRGSRPIDAIWTTPDIEIRNICAMPIGYGIGDHRSFILDVSTRSLVGTDPQPVKRPTARCLNTKIPFCADKYNEILAFAQINTTKYWSDRLSTINSSRN